MCCAANPRPAVGRSVKGISRLRRGVRSRTNAAAVSIRGCGAQLVRHVCGNHQGAVQGWCITRAAFASGEPLQHPVEPPILLASRRDNVNPLNIWVRFYRTHDRIT